jgi:hypothetical protein
LVTKDEEIEIFMKLFRMITNKREFPNRWKIALIQPLYKRKGNQSEPDNYKGLHYYQFWGKYI